MLDLKLMLDLPQQLYDFQMLKVHEHHAVRHC